MPETRRPSDSWIDRQLREVAVPSGMLARLEAIATEAAASESPVETPEAGQVDASSPELVRFEAWLRDVPLPEGAIERWQAVATEEAATIQIVPAASRPVVSRPSYGRLVMAASLMIGIGVTYVGAALTAMGGRHTPAAMGSTEWAEGSFLAAQWSEELVEDLDLPDEVVAFAWIVPPRAGEGMPDDSRAVSRWMGESLASAENRWTAEWHAAGALSTRNAPQDGPDVRAPLGPLGPAPIAMGLGAASAGAADPVGGQSVSDRKWRSIFGDIPASSEDDERFPEPLIVPWRTARGIAPPKVAGFDLPFLIRSGVHPAVALDPRLRADPGLRYCQVPLRSETFSYDLFRRGLTLDRPVLPGPEGVRVEEFLAAIDYGFDPPKKDALELYVAGGPSLFQQSGSVRVGKQTHALPSLPGLIHIGVRAREELDGWRQGCRLTVVIDRSRSMLQGGRMEMVRRGLAELIGQMGPADRLNLVAFDSEPAVLLEDGMARNADERQVLVDAVLKLAAGGATNLVAGLQSAYGVAGSHARDGLQHRLVLLTDGAELSDHALDLLETRLAATRREGLSLFAVDLSEDAWADPQLLRLAEAGGGRLLRAKSVEEVRWALCEVLTGRSQTVANQVELRVEFNPEAVELYRLLGHEASDLDRLAGAPLEMTLRVGQTATALFEILPKARFRPDQALARIELRWQEPYGSEQRVAKTITGAEFPPRFEDASVALQRAAVAAEAAEVLRESPFVERGMTLQRVLDQSGRVRRESAGEESFLRFLQGLGQAAEVQGRGRAR